MKKPQVLITRDIPYFDLSSLEKKVSLFLSPKNHRLNQRELISLIKGKNFTAILSMLTDKINEKVLRAAGPELKIIANFAVGYDNIDIEACTKRRIWVTNTPDVLNEAVAEHSFSLLLASARKIVEADQFIRQKKFHGFEPTLFLGGQIQGKTLGIIGLGRIGSKLSEIAHGFKMRVVYFDVHRQKKLEQKLKIKYYPLNFIIKNSDFLSLHVPLLPATHHLIGKKELKLMKNNCILINTARGPVIDEKALVWALKKGEIAAAGLDVFEKEPKLTTGLTQIKNVVLTPHIASATIEARVKMAKIAINNILNVLEGKKPKNSVNQINV